MPTDWSGLRTDFTGTSIEFPGLLAAALQLVRDNVDIVQGDSEAADEALHGRGYEGEGAILAVGAGLSVRISNGHHWVEGRRHTLAGGPGYVVAEIPASQTSHLYMDAEGVVSAHLARPEENPEGTWYVGAATADSESCLSVDDSEAERVASVAVIAAQVAALMAALGVPWELEDDAQTILASLLAGGDGGGGAEGPIYWGPLERSVADPTRIAQHVDGEIAQHVEEWHGDEDAPGAPGVTLNIEQWEVDAANSGQAVLAITRKLDQNHPDEFEDAIVVVHGVYGDGSGGSPDWVDHVNTTW